MGMALNGVGRRFARPSRRLIAYLRVLGSPRAARGGLRTLREQIELRLRPVVADALGVEPVDLGRETSLIDDLAADSLDVLEVVTRVEALYDIVFPDREIAAIVTYGDLTAITTALVACHVRTREQTSAPASLELRIGDDVAPRFVRVVEAGSAYDHEVLRDDLRGARTGEAVAVTRAATLPTAVERMLMRARLDGAEVRDEDESRPSPGIEPGDMQEWPVRRLIETALAVVEDLDAERNASLASVGEASRLVGKMLAGIRASTAGRIAAFRAVADTYLDVLADSRPILRGAASELGRLDGVRCSIDEHALDAKGVCDAYDAIADALLSHVHALQSLEGAPRMRLPSRRIAPERDAGVPDRGVLRA